LKQARSHAIARATTLASQQKSDADLNIAATPLSGVWLI
jgi:hypothetical protein